MASSEPRARDRNEIVVHYVPKHLRPLPDDPTCGEKDDVVTVTFLGESFLYAIPSFDVLGVELRPAEIKGIIKSSGITKCYDLFIRDHPSLVREYPSTMTIKDVTVIKV